MSAADDQREALRAAMVRLAGGEKIALEQVYRATSAKLFGVVLRILGDEREAEDVVSQVYIEVWRKAGRYDPERASPITWLATLARNRAIDRLRSNKRRAGSVPVDETLGLADDAPRADALLEQAEGSARIHHCLGTLEEKQRNAIATAFFDGVTYAELAEQKNVPLGTMKSWVRRGLAKLKTCMERE